MDGNLWHLLWKLTLAMAIFCCRENNRDKTDAENCIKQLLIFVQPKKKKPRCQYLHRSYNHFPLFHFSYFLHLSIALLAFNYNQQMNLITNLYEFRDCRSNNIENPFVLTAERETAAKERKKNLSQSNKFCVKNDTAAHLTR